MIKTIKNIRDKKIKDVVKIYQIVVDYSYKIDDPISITHFLLETVEQINNDLIKNNKPYRVSFGDEMLNHFVDQNENYLKRKEFYDDDGTFNNFKLEDCLETLDKMKLLYQKNSQESFYLIYHKNHLKNIYTMLTSINEEEICQNMI